MGTSCYKVPKKSSLNKVQDSPPEKDENKDNKEKNTAQTNLTNNNEEELKDKQMAKLSTIIPTNNQLIEQLKTEKSQKEENDTVKPLERSKQGSIKVFFFYFITYFHNFL